MSFDSSEEAMIRFEVPNFTELSKTTFSKVVLLKNLTWQIRISSEEFHLGYWLECGTDTDKE